MVPDRGLAWWRAALLALIVAGLAGCAARGGESEGRRPYVFGWPDFPHPELALRGGSSLGAPVTLLREPSPEWQALQAAGASGRERDQAAIRALAGGYRVSFDFLETLIFDPALEPDQPYRSWGTEKVIVLEDRPGFVSLQHVMVMFALADDGEVRGPFVQKHWRQDWQYEPERMHAYEGFGQWSWRGVSRAERSGAWSQTVFQVDDAPRYSLVGRWEHQPGFSSWSSADGWRPLPRRESSVRDDYQVLEGPNRITLLPTGWVHEQDNLKRVLGTPADATGTVRARAREIGLARYERLVGFDFSAGDAYWKRTEGYWRKVREGWASRIDASPRQRIEEDCLGIPLFVTLFQLAEAQPADAQSGEADVDASLAAALDCAVAPAGPGGAPEREAAGPEPY